MNGENRTQNRVIEYKGVLILEDEALVLKQIEKHIDYSLSPTDSLISSGFIVKDHHVVKIKLNSFRKTEFIEYIHGLSNLITLDIQCKELNIIPSSIGLLTNLKHLKIDAKITTLPKEIGQLHSLEKLILDYCKLTTLPDEIGKLQSLKKLNVERNQLAILPCSIGDLKSLESLILNNNEIVKIPDSIGNLRHLKKLILHYNHIKSLPDSVGDLVDLSVLNLSHNQLQYLPDSIGNMRNLIKLNVSHNSLTEIAESIGYLTKLNEIDLSKNKLKILPFSIGSLEKLEFLELGYNSLRNLPLTLWDLTNLKRLRLHHNFIDELDKGIVNLTELWSLDLKGNNSIRLPEGLDKIFKRDYLHPNLPEYARVIPPSLLMSSRRNFRKSIRKCFDKSIHLLENGDDFLKAWLMGDDNLYPFILKLAEANNFNIMLYKREIENQTHIEKLDNLSQVIKARNERAPFRIQFVNLVESSGSISYPMGLLYVSAKLKAQGYTDIKYFDYPCYLRDVLDKNRPYDFYEKEIHKNWINFRSYMDKRNPYILFIGPVTSVHLVELVDLIPKLRQRYPRMLILAGGPHFGKNKEMDHDLLTVHCKDLDGIIVGEAEDIVADIMERLYSHNRDTYPWYLPEREEFNNIAAEIPGVLLRDERFIDRDPPEMDSLPYPDLDILEEYWENNPNTKPYYTYSLCDRRNPRVIVEMGYVEDAYGGGVTMDDVYYFDDLTDNYSLFPFGIIVGSRGCPFKCTFCCSHGRRRVHTPQRVYNQMVTLHDRFNINLFVFFDPLFTSATQKEQKRIDDLCELILESKHVFKYLIEIRVDVILGLSNDLLIKMIRSGCVEFNLGLEKGSDKCLQRMMKSVTIEDQFLAIEKIRNAALQANTEVLINGTFIHGGPGENKKDVRDTVIHCMLLDLDGVMSFLLEIHPGTEIYNDALSEGIIESGIGPYLDITKYPIYTNDHLPFEYLKEIQNLTNETFRALREVRSRIFLLEREILRNVKDYKPGTDDYMQGSIFKKVREFIETLLKIVKDNPDQYIEDNIFKTAIVQKVNEEVLACIKKGEKQIIKQEPEYEYLLGKYDMGNFSGDWNIFKKALSRLINKKRF